MLNDHARLSDARQTKHTITIGGHETLNRVGVTTAKLSPPNTDEVWRAPIPLQHKDCARREITTSSDVCSPWRTTRLSRIDSIRSCAKGEVK